ncbi:unnamed protein product [Lampetra fluviatilis]
MMMVEVLMMILVDVLLVVLMMMVLVEVLLVVLMMVLVEVLMMMILVEVLLVVLMMMVLVEVLLVVLMMMMLVEVLMMMMILVEVLLVVLMMMVLVELLLVVLMMAMNVEMMMPVTGEDDSTDKGIRYFYPPETDEDEQRLLCSQFPGVARCVAEITCRPPFMLHLRHVKFALRTQGPFFLALGCITSLPDGCCRHMLDRLLVLFTCYRGPLRLAYQQGSGPPWPIWEPFLDHVQRAVRYLPGLFSTVRYLNKREVDPLLLLKAALILQSCQRCPHVLAGCILHNLTVVSSQLTPQVTAHLLAARNVHRHEEERSNKEVGSSEGGVSGDVAPSIETRSGGQPQCSDEVSGVMPSEGRQHLDSDAPMLLDSAETSPELQPLTSHNRSSGRGAAASISSRAGAAGVSRLALPKRAPVSPYADQGEDQARFVSAASESDSSLPSPSPSASLPSFSSSSPSEVESGGGARGEESVRSREFPAQAPRGFVRLALYVQAKPEITLVLLAEDALRNDGSAQDELFTSNLASLNGLDVHLKEVFAQTPSDQRKHSYSFLCYDRVLRSLQGMCASTPERDLCRAASLMHSEFRRSPAITEITLRSSTACVYGAQTPAQEVFFQVSPSQRSGMVGPGFADGTYRLPGAARSKLQQHGINLP